MLDSGNNAQLPPIPNKRYFTIGEVAQLCLVKPHVLRYWEQEFAQLSPVKRRGNRRYYQRHDIQLIRRIRSLLYIEGFTISGAKNQVDIETTSKEAATTSIQKTLIEELKMQIDEVVIILKNN